METLNPHWVGTIAATLTTLSFVPQAWKILRTKDTSAISLWMYWMFTVGVLHWLIYGVMLGSPPMMIANIVTLLLAIMILAMKIRYG